LRTGSKDLVIEASFLFLTVMTFVTMILFIFEGLELYRRLKPKHSIEQVYKDNDVAK